MSKDVALGILIGGAVSSTLGSAVGKTASLIGGLKARAEDARGLQALIGRTQQLQREFSEAFKSGGKGADNLRRQIDQHNAALKKAGVDVAQLDRTYARLGKTIKGIEWQAAGAEQMQSGVQLGKTAMASAGTLAIPTKISADYQAEIRDIAIKGNFAGTDKERDMDQSIRQTAADSGMNQKELAVAINQLVAGGMGADEAIKYAGSIGKFSVGQNTTPEDTAKMVRALSQNAKITDPKAMDKALQSIAFLGNEGNFESPDMAKAFPGLLAEMGKLDIYGQDAVTQLGAMLQVQMKVTGSADEAANNMRNWFSKISAPDTIEKYKKAGIDYGASMAEFVKAGRSPLEASMELAKAYIKQVDPKKAAAMEKAFGDISKESDPEKRKKQIAALQESMKMGDVFGDMQVKAALTAFMQNEDEYRKLKEGSEKADGVLEQALADRRATSAQKWAEASNAFQASMVSLGDALRPVTDTIADLAAGALQLGSSLAQGNPGLALGAVAIGLGVVAVAAKRIITGATQWAAGKVLEGAGMKLPGGKKGGPALPGAAGKALGALTGVQQVFVTNWPGGGFAGGDGPDAGGKGKPGARTGRAGRFGRLGSALGRAGGFLGRNAGGVLAAGTAAYQVYDTYANAKTGKEKGAGYGSAAGSLAGGLAGAKLGAIIGAMGGPIGMAIGGVLGGAIGTFAGSKLGSMVGEKIAMAEHKAPTGGPRMGNGIGGRTPASVPATAPVAGIHPPPIVVTPPPATTARAAAPAVPAAVAAATPAGLPPSRPGGPGAAAPKTQSFVFSPTIQVTVKGDVKDPAQVAASIAPHLKRIFDGWQQQAGRSAMFDPVG